MAGQSDEPKLTLIEYDDGGYDALFLMSGERKRLRDGLANVDRVPRSGEAAVLIDCKIQLQAKTITKTIILGKIRSVTWPD